MKICTVDGCGRPHRARELCSTHYNRRFQPDRHPLKAVVACARCGRSCAKAPDPRRPRQFCSLACRTADQFSAARAAKALVHVGPAWPRTEIPLRHPCRLPAGSRSEWWALLIAGSCGWCGEYFIGCAADISHAPRYCSDRCRVNAGKSRTRFLIPRAQRLAIYERDGWVCQLCSDPVDPELGPADPWAATLDHIECQSWGTADHSPKNLRLAHRWCNSVRGDERYYTADVLAA